MTNIINAISIIGGIILSIFSIYYGIYYSDGSGFVDILILALLSFITGYIATIVIFYFVLTLIVTCGMILLAVIALASFAFALGIIAQFLQIIT